MRVVEHFTAAQLDFACFDSSSGVANPLCQLAPRTSALKCALSPQNTSTPLVASRKRLIADRASIRGSASVVSGPQKRLSE